MFTLKLLSINISFKFIEPFAVINDN